jgi:aerobic-type carbon monoxide dehydrogenase small subunit (CoxS/CutS family)
MQVMRQIREFVVNGKSVRVDVDEDRTLLSVLREELKLTGTKYGCGEGQCGSCTVLIDGVPRRSCTIAVGTVTGKRITTIEGLEKEEQLHPVQQAFLTHGAFQCGFCTPGMIMAAVGLLQQQATPSEEEIRRSMQSNICRCGVYSRILEAVKQSAPLKGEKL